MQNSNKHRRNIAGPVPIEWVVSGHMRMKERIATCLLNGLRGNTLHTYEAMAEILEGGIN